jgi:putative membrane protein
MQKLKKYKIIAVIIAVIAIPLVYSYFYLDAFWDPYSKLDNLPVAVVNQDKGTAINGENRNLGKEITDRLGKDKSLKWVIASESDAKSGLEDRRYYAVINIPGDFSENISTAGNSEKSQGVLIYNVNEKRNYLASQVLNRVTLEFKDEISNDVTKEIVGTLLDQIKSVPDDLKKLDDGLNQLRDGAGKIYEGTNGLVNGQKSSVDGLQALNKGLNDTKKGSALLAEKSGELSDGANRFHQALSGSKDIASLLTGSKDFSDGISRLNSGVSQLNTGVSLIAPKVTEMQKGMSDLDKGLQSFTSGLNNYVESVNKAAEAQDNMGTAIVKYAKSHPDALNDPNFKAVVEALEASSSGSEQLKLAGSQLTASGKNLADGSGKISAGITQLSGGMGSLSKSIGTLAAGSNQLAGSYPVIDQGIRKTIKTAAETSGQLSVGALAISHGNSQLSDGILKLKDGGNRLLDGSDKLYAGAKQLQSGMGDLKNGISEAGSSVSSSLLKAGDELNGTDGLKEYIADPVKLTEKKLHGIPDYGTAFTPYFVSLSLWVGALMMFFAIYLDPDVKFRRLAKESRGLLRYAAYSFIGIAQALILDIVLLAVLHLQVANTFLFIAASIVISLSFTSIIRFLLTQLKDVGKFAAILLLILQLTSCGGTFPMELVPHFFNVINPFMPMTYSVNTLKEVISGISNGYLVQNLLILVAIMVVFTILNLAASKLRLGNLLADSGEAGRLSEEASA